MKISDFKIGDSVKLLVNIDTTKISTLKAGTVGTVCCFFKISEGFVLIGVDFHRTLPGLHDIGKKLKINSGYLCKPEQLIHVNKILKIKEWLLQ